MHMSCWLPWTEARGVNSSAITADVSWNHPWSLPSSVPQSCLADSFPWQQWGSKAIAFHHSQVRPEGWRWSIDHAGRFIILLFNKSEKNRPYVNADLHDLFISTVRFKSRTLIVHQQEGESVWTWVQKNVVKYNMKKEAKHKIILNMCIIQKTRVWATFHNLFHDYSANITGKCMHMPVHMQGQTGPNWKLPLRHNGSKGCYSAGRSWPDKQAAYELLCSPSIKESQQWAAELSHKLARE